MTNIKWMELIVFIMTCEVLGAAGGIFTIKSIPTWYATLRKPTFNPPNWIFGPVWTLLYGLQGVAIYLIFQHQNNTTAIHLFIAQFILNMLWTPLFFGAKKLGPAFFEILVMFVCILFTIISFSKLDMQAAWLMMPYAIWVAFASLLNYKIWKLN